MCFKVYREYTTGAYSTSKKTKKKHQKGTLNKNLQEYS